MEQNKNPDLPPTTYCRSGCGFYGNDSFDGLCSKCYKDQLKRKQSSSPITSAGRSTPTTACGEAELMNSVSSTLAKTNLGGENGSSGSETELGSTTPSVETATPTIPVHTGSSDKDREDTGATGGSEVEASSPDTSTDKKKRNRCHTCKKKVGLTGFQCRCGGLYCSLHRYSDKHECTFDYKEHGAEQIRKHNPVVVAEKVQKI